VKNMQSHGNWRDVLGLSIVPKCKSEWNLMQLEKIILQYIIFSIVKCSILNKEVICTTLSGGIDSSFCLAKIREAVGEKISIHTFTIGLSKSYPDIGFARIVADKFNTIHHEIIPSEREVNEAKMEMQISLTNWLYSPGDVAVFIIYKEMAKQGFKSVIAHDGIDELLGGYWKHRDYDNDLDKKEETFQYFWDRLEFYHLLPLERISQYFGINLALPYLQRGVVEYISKIPLNERTSFKESKIPLRMIAKKYLPREVIEREKKGFCSALGEV
jgi:asparagine synthetase B (glutamine-hydrolysing)